MKTRPNTSCLGWRLQAGGRRQEEIISNFEFRISKPVQPAAFTLVELLVVVAIIALSLAVVVPTLGSFFDSARGPNARNLISAYLMGARNYAVANSTTTALVFSQEGSDILMFLAEEDPLIQGNFVAVAGRETTYLPDHIMVIPPDPLTEEPDFSANVVIVSFLPIGQLTRLASINQITMPSPPGSVLIDGVAGVNAASVTDFYLYDFLDSDNPQELSQLYINYYTGSVID